MRTVRTVGEVRAASRDARAAGGRVGFVPTMGYLHDGHYSLVQEARRRDDLVIASIFVNPTQFGPGEDLARYPTDLDGDRAGLQRNGCDVLWLPDAQTLYPPGSSTWVTVEALSAPLCGARRPGHFRGVATVVAKLLAAAEPDDAYFGDKDYQQRKVIERLVEDLCLPVRVVGLPIVREPDGLAMSSRNAYLSPADRAAAPVLRRSLDAARAAFDAGGRDPRALEAVVRRVVATEPRARLDYAEVRDAADLSAVDRCEGPVVLCLAAFVGAARLIDNQVLTP